MKKPLFLSAVLVLVSCSSVFAAEDAAAPKKATSLDKELYIDAFLQGALLTDEAIVNSLDERGNKASTFAERAYLTRLGRQVPSTFRAGFCLPDDVSYDKVIKIVSQSLSDSTELSRSTLGEAVYGILKMRYPCN